MFSAAFVAFIALAGQTAAATPVTAAEAVAKVQAFYAQMNSLESKFRQEYNNTTFGKKSVSDGKLYISKPGKMRWDYMTPEKKHFISDGTTLWVYEVANKQAFQQSLQDQVLPVAISFLYGKGDLATEFNAALDPGRYGAKGDIVLKLTPKKPSAQYKNLWLVLDPKDHHVKESVILEASDNINHFKFTKLEVNSKDASQAKHYVFNPKTVAGLKVIQPQQQTPPNGGVSKPE